MISACGFPFSFLPAERPPENRAGRYWNLLPGKGLQEQTLPTENRVENEGGTAFRPHFLSQHPAYALRTGRFL